MESLKRTKLLIGEDNINLLKNKHVCIFGLGGVGGHAIDAIVRSGIGEVTLIDNDIVSESNINRQLIASYKTLGRKKTEVMKEHLLDLNPNLKANLFNMFVLPNNIDEIDFSKFDYVVDAIDTVTAKLEIIKKCDKIGIPLICSMGTGNKLNPTDLYVTDIYKTSYDPLAKAIRKKCRDLKIKKLKVVCSKEISKKTISLEESTASKHVPGSIAFVPSVAGEIIASEVIKDLIKM